ncbi:T9SS type A sorting domain-containing protein [Hymenobacter gummosus]|uniref:T9SS type A sorting domain-containing protein n=1 Tax=Hymenobacter gummosus TaxID=1776032 RepID=A0A431U2L6_9BACT|nr:T9SS type A sorting domain-containing protein [Hymenobacter gummosus]RTQ49594.1 T9SS type A sorting domain-containing protein [Hymenobacter gummosus]
MSRPNSWWPRLLAALLLVLAGTPAAWAQLTGSKAIPGDYATLSAAITDLNTAGVGAGGVTFNVAAGYTETAANLLITATGTAANPIVFQKSGTGANPLISAGVGTSTTLDGIIRLSGSDYVTFDGIDLAENSANTTATTQTEFGYAMFRASVTDGCQNNVIKNCVVTLNKTNPNSIGIFGASSLATATTALTVTAASGINSNNKVFGNVVSNAATGIQFSGSSAAGFLDSGNEIGVTAGNTVGNFGSSTSNWGVGGSNQISFRITGNTINSTLNYTSATASTPVAASTVTSTLRGIYVASGTSANIDITNNTITLASGATTSQVSGIENGAGNTPAANTVNITGNTLRDFTYASGTSATTYYIYNSASPATVNISNNTISNCSATSTSSSSAIIYNNSSAATITVQNNQVSGITRAGASGTQYGYYNNGSGTGTQTLTGNVFNNITVAGSTTFYGLYSTTASGETQVRTNNTISNVTGGTGSLYGLFTSYGAAASQFNGNTVSGLASGGSVYGLYFSNSSFSGYSAYDNVVSGLSSTGTSSVVYGIYTSPTTVSLYRNKVYDLSGTGTGVAVYGIYTIGGTTITIHNNLVGDLRAPAATGLNAVTGLYFSSGTTINAYFNTVYLNASSAGATFGTSGIYFSTTPTTVDLRNNIVVNKSTAAGTGGYTAALRRASGTAGTVPANLASTTNNNLYYAGTPSATNLIYVEGTTTATNAQQTIAGYKGFVAPRETNSVSEDVAFLSTTGSAATFLHINPATATQVESGGQPISGITTDFDGDTRNATTPDLGADEGTFTPQDLSGPSIVYTALGNTPSTANRTLDVTITDPSGIATAANAPRLYYRKAGSSTYAFVNATSVSGNVYTFTFDFAAIGGVTGFDQIQYYVAAQDNSPNQNGSSSPVGGTGTNPPGTTFSGTPNSFFIQGALSGTYYVGTSTSPAPARTYATLTAAATAYNNNTLGGAVTFVLLDAAYSATTGETFPVVFTANAAASATNSLTIKPNTGVTATITGSSSASAVLQLLGTDYLTVDGSASGTSSRELTLTSTNTGGSAVVWVGSLGDAAGATNVTLKNLNVVGGSVTSTTAFGIYAAGTSLSTSGTGGDNDNLVIQNNVVSSAYQAIYARGTTTGVLDGLQVTSNQIGGSTAATTVTYRGIDVASAAGAVISLNRIVGMQTTGSISISAIELGTTVSNAAVSRNYISNLRSTSTSGYGAYGINFSSTTNVTGNEISNNMISDLITDGDGTSTTFNPFGIRLTGGTGTKVYYNSVNLAGAFTNLTTGDLSAALLVTSSSVTGLDLRNNVLANSLTGGSGTKSYALYLTSAASVGTFNYNDYYVSGANGVLGYVAADKADLAALRASTTQDANSVSGNPQFTSATDLHVTNSVDLSNSGTPVSVTVDYDGDARSATTPDIGADEFVLPPSIDLGPVALISPAAGVSCYSTTEAVTVAIRAIGGSALNFATTPATVTVVVTPPSGTAQTLTTTVNTGTLASGAVQNVTLPGTIDMSAVGAYTFAITATVQGDVNTANDVLATVTRTVTAPAAGTLATNASSFCVSGTATLTLTGSANGSIQLQQSTDNVTFTDVQGATGATFTTPLLTQTTYFRARTTCNTNVATSNVVTVTVTNPQVTGTNSPVTICSGSTATLTATAGTGATIRFYDVATGGTALATGTSFTTPALTASRQYFVEATSTFAETAGKVTPNTNGTLSAASGLIFNVTTPVVLQTVTVYSAGASGTVSIQLQNAAGTVLQTATGTVTAGTSAAPVASTITLNFSIPAGTGYKLVQGGGTNLALVRDDDTAGNNSFPYTSPSGSVSITNGTLAGYYYYFYNWQVTSDCVGTRTPIQVNVTQPATATLPAATATSCGTSGFQLGGTVGGSATGGTYTTSGTGTFAPNATTLNATYTPSAADLAAGTVTLTLTTSGPGACAPATAQVVLTLGTPATAGFSYANASYCSSAAAATPTLTAGATAGTFSSTTGLTINATTGAITPSTSTPGTYTVTNTVAATSTCPAVTATTTVTINAAPAQPTVTVAYGGPGTATLTSSSATGNQWYLNNQPIPGATGQTYAVNGVTNPGAYTVIVTGANGCASPASAQLTITKSQQPLTGTTLRVFPNPTPDGKLTLELTGYRKAVDVTLLNAVGQVVARYHLPAGQTTQAVDLTALPAGVYTLRAVTEGGTDTRRIVRE